jgi:hypothetical protein
VTPNRPHRLPFRFAVLGSEQRQINWVSEAWKDGARLDSDMAALADSPGSTRRTVLSYFEEQLVYFLFLYACTV